MKNAENFVLVTGSPRSGTTVVGELLALRSDTFYLYEPMNYHSGDETIPEYFSILGSKSFPESKADQLLMRIRQFKLRLKPGLWPHEHGLKKMRKRLIGGRSKISHAVCKYHPFLKNVIWKDPFAFFSIPYLLEKTDMPIVITRRPTGGIAGSFKRFGWGFDVETLLGRLNDPALPEALLADLDLTNPVVNACVLWEIMQKKTADFVKNPRVMVVDIPDLIADPVDVTKRLYRHCNMTFTDNVAVKVQKRYSKSGGAAVPTGTTAHVKDRDVKAVNTYWKTLLSDDEKLVMSEIAQRFATATKR